MTPPTEQELHAYLDAALNDARRAEVAAWLLAHPETALRLDAYRQQGLALRRLADPVLDEPLPAALRRAAGRPPAAPLNAWRRLAAACCLLAVGALGGWLAHARLQTDQRLAHSLPRQAAVAHAVYSPDQRRPVEIAADQEEQLVRWLSRRLGSPLRVPQLAALGYQLVGGRLLPGEQGPVAQFMYQAADGERLTLYLSGEFAQAGGTAFRFAQEGEVRVFYWVDGPFGYALSGRIGRDQLASLASAVYAQLAGH